MRAEPMLPKKDDPKKEDPIEDEEDLGADREDEEEAEATGADEADPDDADPVEARLAELERRKKALEAELKAAEERTRHEAVEATKRAEEARRQRQAIHRRLLQEAREAPITRAPQEDEIRWIRSILVLARENEFLHERIGREHLLINKRIMMTWVFNVLLASGLALLIWSFSGQSLTPSASPPAAAIAESEKLKSALESAPAAAASVPAAHPFMANCNLEIRRVDGKFFGRYCRSVYEPATTTAYSVVCEPAKTGGVFRRLPLGCNAQCKPDSQCLNPCQGYQVDNCRPAPWPEETTSPP